MTSEVMEGRSVPVGNQLIAIGLLGLIAPLLFIGLTLIAGIPFDTILEPVMYVRPALGLLETGSFSIFENGVWTPNFVRLPGYLYVLALTFALFGSTNYLAVALVQSVMVAATVLGTALCAREINHRWMWPAAVLAMICPNLTYRAATIMPEATFGLFFIWGLWFCLRATTRGATVRRLIFAGLLLGSAFMTRPVMMLFPILAYPGLAYLLRSSGKLSWRRSIVMAAIPMIVIASMASTQFYRNYKTYGHLTFTIQSGQHALGYLYPCLAKAWGCGDQNHEAIRISQSALQARLAVASEETKRNPVLSNRIYNTLAMELILDIPIPRVLSSLAGSTLKFLLHTSYTEILTNFGQDALFFSEVRGNSIFERALVFVKGLFSDPLMAPWPFIMAALFGSRLLQTVGIFCGLTNPEIRPKLLFLTLSIVGFLITAIGIGNPRYRVPLEPVLIILTVAGADFLWRRLQLWRQG